MAAAEKPFPSALKKSIFLKLLATRGCCPIKTKLRGTFWTQMEPLTGRFDDERAQNSSNSIEMGVNEGRVGEFEMKTDESSPRWPNNKPTSGDELNIVEETAKIDQQMSTWWWFVVEMGRNRPKLERSAEIRSLWRNGTVYWDAVFKSRFRKGTSIDYMQKVIEKTVIKCRNRT